MPKDEAALLALFFALLAAMLWFGRPRPLGYRRVEAIFTPAELKFYKILQELLPAGCHIFAKVRVADVILPKKGSDRSRWRAAFNRVACKHFDYIVCDEEMRFAIELDDASHQKRERKERDRFLEWACESAGVELLRVPLRREYDRATLKRHLRRLCKGAKRG